MSELSQMPVVTVEQIVRFREAAIQIEKQRDELLAAAENHVKVYTSKLSTAQEVIDADNLLEAAIAKAVQP